MIETLTLEEIDRTLYEYIRLELTAQGYLPDVTNITTSEDYIQAKQTILDSGKQVIEVFGYSATESKDNKSSCKLIIERGSLTMGSLGAAKVPQFNKTGSTWTKVELPHSSFDIDYTIRIIANSVDYERVLSIILINIFGSACFKYIVKDYNKYEDKGVNIQFNGDADVTSTTLMERVFRYSVKDVWLGDLRVIREGVVPLNSIQFNKTLKSNYYGDDKIDYKID